MITCEEYVLKELEEAKEKIRKLEKDNRELLKGGMFFMDFLKVLRKYMHEEEGASGMHYITMSYVFQDYEAEDFEFLQGVMMSLEENDDE